jgi:hypothetical protein
MVLVDCKRSRSAVVVEVLLLRYSRGAPLYRLSSPPGGPSLTPSAVDKTAVLDVVDDIGNSEAAEACTPSAASDSFFIRRPGGIFLAISREDCRL